MLVKILRRYCYWYVLHCSVKSDEVSQKAWQIDVHPSRLTDLGLNTEVDENFTNRTDRFANERFKNTTQPVKLPIRDDRLERRGRGRGRGERRSRWGMDDRRRGDDRSDRSRRGEDRSDRSRVESGERRQKEESGVNKTGDLAAGERKHESERTDQQMVDEIKMEEDNEAGDGERRGRQMDGRRGRGRRGRMREKSREEREKEDREFQEKRLLDSLTDPRDVPKGTSYFEVSPSPPPPPSSLSLFFVHVYKRLYIHRSSAYKTYASSIACVSLKT